MCGIAGIARACDSGVSIDTLARMAAAIRHRGPDGYGFYASSHAGLAHVRLSVVDLARGAQPLTNEDGQIVITYNGEVYNHPELRRDLQQRGHVFATRCDTEVLVHAYEEWGAEMLARLNGQFAFAIYDAPARRLFLARDRFGVRPLFYALNRDSIYFASEAKALFASAEIQAHPDPTGLDETFLFWGPRAPRTPFAGVAALAPGSYAIWQHGSLAVHSYYEVGFSESPLEPADAIEQLDELLRSSVGLRMRADVPVGAYLSGGLDSSITATLAAASTPHQLRSFSISFADPRYDESEYQQAVARSVGTRHAVASISGDDIARSFPAVVRHVETPLVRTAPAPMYHLARLTKEHGIKVVLTGEGADELFLGYDLFKEVAVRRFCLRQPASQWRPRLFDRLYPYLLQGGNGAGDFWRKFFVDASRPDDPLFSHVPRFLLSAWIREFYAPEFGATVAKSDVIEELRRSLPAAYSTWSPLNQAAYLEIKVLLGSYLLGAQSDRMAMAHGIEGRFPFLDHRLFQFAASLPTSSRLLGLREKEILRRWARRVLPPAIGGRAKHPYRAPDAVSFFGPGAPEYVRDLMSPAALARSGIWSARAVGGLVRRCDNGRATGFRENQALVAILSTQLWQQEFLAQPAVSRPLDLHRADVLIQDGSAVATLS